MVIHTSSEETLRSRVMWERMMSSGPLENLRRSKSPKSEGSEHGLGAFSTGNPPRSPTSVAKMDAMLTTDLTGAQETTKF